MIPTILAASCCIYYTSSGSNPIGGHLLDDDIPKPRKEEDEKPEYVPRGFPLHGNPDPEKGTANAVDDKRDESELAERALGASAEIVGTSGGATAELLDLLERAEGVTEGGELSEQDVVALRINLQRFRGHSDHLAARIDAEVDRLEALLLGMKVKKGNRHEGKHPLTGQTRNRGHKTT